MKGNTYRDRALHYFLTFLGVVFFMPSANAQLSSTLVSPTFVTSAGYDSEYQRVSATLYVDPAITNWVAWSDSFGTPSPTSADPYACPTGMCIGRHGFGTDDYIKMTVTNPFGTALTANIDFNDASGNSSGAQMVLFGTAADAPDVRRYNFFTSSYYYINEAGAFNSVFTTAGNYRFDFSFRNLWSGSTGHANIYLLKDVNPVPEPETYALLIIGLGFVGFMVRCRRRKLVD